MNIFTDSKKEYVFKEWKESILSHPKKLSSKYNVNDYQNMIPYATNKYKNEIVQNVLPVRRKA